MVTGKMARETNKLTAAQVKNTFPGARDARLADGGGMFLLIKPNGAKWWRLDYRFAGKKKTLSLGVYPEVSLKEARVRRDDAKAKLADGVDPSIHRQVQKASLEKDTFEQVGREWWIKHSPNWSQGHGKRILTRFENDLFPWLGSRPIGSIAPPELLACLRRIENRGALETAHRARNDAGQVFRYAVAIGLAERDPSQDLKGALPPYRSTHHASIVEPKAIGQLLRDIDAYEGNFVTKCALRLAPLLFVRPGELRHAEWSEIDFEVAEWRIPKEKMKMNAPHLVPLADQALKILRELHPFSGRGKYLFPGLRSQDRPMSENTVNAALRRLGYDKNTMTGHGFRSMASTRLNEMGWNRDAIERQLAHAERDSVRAAYNYAEHLDERRKMMTEWANHLDKLKKERGSVVLD